MLQNEVSYQIWNMIPVLNIPYGCCYIITAWFITEITMLHLTCHILKFNDNFTLLNVQGKFTSVIN